MSRFLCLSSGIAHAPELTPLLKGSLHLYHPLTRLVGKHRNMDAVLGWGMKANTAKARKLAAQLQLPFWGLEDGFISYLGHPSLGDRRFSLIVDKTGIYYDATQPSDLEVHPDVVLGTKRGYYELEPCGTKIKGFTNDRIRVLAGKVNAQSLFPYFDKVDVVTSQLGFEALWHRKPVNTKLFVVYGNLGVSSCIVQVRINPHGLQ